MALRSALVDHMKALGKMFIIPNKFFRHNLWVIGTRPMYDQTLNSIELFQMLEGTIYHTFRETYHDVYNDVYEVRAVNNDGSYRLGFGKCNFAVVEMAYFDDGGWKQSVDENDCYLVVKAIHDHASNSTRIMKHSIQPVTPLAAPRELVEDFGVEKVIKALENSGTHPTVDSLTDRWDARVLYCADSVKSELCKSMRRVFSTEGISIAINAVLQKDLFRQAYWDARQSTFLLDDPNLV